MDGHIACVRLIDHVTGMYVWRGNGKRYVKQRRTIASIDDRTDGNNRPNKSNRYINSCDDDDKGDDDDNNDDEDENGDNDDADDEDATGTECLSTTICKTLRRCSRCTEAICNEASIDLSASGGAIA